MTAEFAVGLPVVLVVLGLVLTLGVASVAHIRATDAARVAARHVALDSTASVEEVVVRVAGNGATVNVVRDGPWVEVTVSTPVVGGWLARSPLRATAKATAWSEP